MAVETGTVQVVMPAMGDSVAEGTVLEWHKQEGDAIEVDETLVEISTDKVDAEVPAPVAGTVVKIHAAEGDTVVVGGLLAEISTNGADTPPPDSGSVQSPPATGAPADGASATPVSGDVSSATPVSAESPPATPGEALAGAATEAEGEAATEASVGETIDIVTPTGGESVTEGTILEWSVKVGDHVKDGDTVVEISTDKVDMELPAPASGTITEILAADGDTVTVGQVIARMTSRAGGAAPPSAHARRPTAGAATGHAPRRSAAAGGDGDGATSRRSPAGSPHAEGVDLSRVQGTARGGRIIKADVLAVTGNGAAATPAGSPEAGTGPVPQLLRGGAAALARYMDESRSIPTATSFRTLTVTVLDARRTQLKDAGHRVSFTHLIAYAIARVATDEMPVMAHHFAEIDGKPHRIDDAAVNLGLAVDVEKKDGSRTLMVPVIRDAGRLTFPQFLDAYNALVEKARTNTLTADDLTGANMSLTNPGGIGTVASVPRLMAGQGTIVATGSIAYPVGLGRIGATIGAEKVMTMTSTYDHRIIQGAESGRFLQRVEALLQGEDGFYERVFADLGAQLPELPPPPAPAPGAAAAAPATDGGPAASPTRSCSQARPGGDLAAEGPSHARPPRREARPARPRARGRPGARSRPARPDPRADGEDPGADPADVRPGRDARRRAAAPARDVLRSDRIRDRAHRLAPPAAVAARGDRVRHLPQAAHQRRTEGAAPSPHRGRRARALHAQGVPRPEAVLDRGARHDRADARRADPARRDPRRARGRDRHRSPGQAEHPCA